MEEEKKDQAILEDNDDDIPNTNVPIDFEECAVTDNPPEQAELDEKDDEPVEPSAADTDTKVAPDDDSKQGEKKEPDDPDDDADNGKSGTPRGVQKRIDQLRRKAGDAETEADTLRAENEALRKRMADDDGESKKPAAETDTEPKKPIQDDYDTYDDYIDALTDYKADKREAKLRTEFDAKFAEKESETASKSFVADKVNAGVKAHADFKEVALDESLPYTEVMQAAVFDSEQFTEVAYYLGKHPDEVSRIADLSPLAQVKAIGAIEVTVSSEKPKPKPKKETIPLSEPIVPIGGNDIIETDLTNASFDDYCRAREKNKP